MEDPTWRARALTVVRVPKGLLKGIYRLPQRDLEGRALSKSFISRVIIGVTPFRVLITLLITYLLSPLPLQVNPKPETP